MILVVPRDVQGLKLLPFGHCPDRARGRRSEGLGQKAVEEEKSGKREGDAVAHGSSF
jgi:hypothetical protein